MADEKIKCPKCGTENNATDSFCAECGKNLEEKSHENFLINAYTKLYAGNINTSDKNSIIQSEENIAVLDNVGLTNEQVYQVYSQLGGEYFISIFLKDVSSIELGYKSHPILILLAIISGFGIYFYYQSPVFAWTVAIILLIIFFVTRQSVLKISSQNNKKITHHIMSNSRAKEFVKKVIEAKKKYL